MSRPLDVPDGMNATAVADPDGPMVEFYTGRWPIRYSRAEVMELIDALQSWLEETTPGHRCDPPCLQGIDCDCSCHSTS